MGDHDLIIILTAFALTGLGAPIAYIPVTGAAIDDVGDDSGLASGLFNTTQQVADAFALTVMATVVAVGSVLSLRGTGADGGGDGAELSVTGVRAGFVAAAAMALLAALAAGRLREHPPTPAPDAPKASPPVRTG